jgi:toxin-antitoxin system PIN domain toxin
MRFRPDAPHHEVCRPWLEGIVKGDARFGLSRLALAAVVRITTHSSPFKSPSALTEVFRFCDFLLGQPHCQVVEPGERHWGILRQLCVETDTRGRRVSDAWYAALAIEWGCEWITMDRDFSRFPGLKWSLPA